jgi:hypothetical protein
MMKPWLGATDARPGSWAGSWGEGNDDREEDTADDEPWLGAANPNWSYQTPFVNLLLYRKRDPHLWRDPRIERTRETSQSSWCSNGCSDDREWECEDEGAQCEDEGAFGANSFANPR